IQPSWRKDFKAEWKKLVGRELKILTISSLGNMENSFFKNIQRNDQYSLLYEATQSIWKAINNSNNSPVELTNHEIDYYYEIDLSMDEHDSS
ncbi:12477_t:CDS:2, partial [Dentiscutata erythropus]